jgi:RNA polymerase II subunit A C-terminal domain phosphatase SSU72
LVDLLERNAKIKTAPERFQDVEVCDFDIVLTYEIKCFEDVNLGFFFRFLQLIFLLDINRRQPTLMKQCHIINMETKDSGEEAAIAGRRSAELVETV